ncbi:BrnA antitoxin family protein [Pseudotabrizicola algicola]|uniref:BrnA antitoxin family protein n=1 Tax=Pseudotabrizicola algicola TaxID=2709381 RepID=A0A6B3RM02_9RHOB|nr:BrnA antitoxin family protein [Pseudotabrizicola algicola]NEX47080.1 BrnA antitoxin family protein [Pseudotabrizicola algicola]
MTTRKDQQNASYHRMAESLRDLERALHGGRRANGAVPEEWHAIAQGVGAGRKVKLTLWVEADVLRFFRTLGKGHTTRMAEVLSTFMHARLAGVVKGPEDVNYSAPYYTPEEQQAIDERMRRNREELAEELRRARRY